MTLFEPLRCHAPPLREEEATPADPPLAYGWAKITGETLVESAVAESDGFRGAIGRLIGVYGPGQDTDLQRASVIPALIRRAAEYPAQGPFTIRGDGRETRSFCYIADVLDAILLSVEKLDAFPVLGPINIGSEGQITIRDLARRIIATSGKDIELVFAEGEPSVWGQSVDCSKARQLLDGWDPNVPLNEGLQKTYQYVSTQLQQMAGRTV